MRLLFVAVALLAVSHAHAQTCNSINVGYIVDASASVTGNLFQTHEMYLVRELSKFFGNYQQASVTQFANVGQVDVNCGSVSTQAQFEATVNGIQQNRGGTCIVCGLEKAEQEANCDGQKTLFIVFVDGRATVTPSGTTLAGTAANIRNKGHDFYAFGIGGTVAVEELEQITGDTTGARYEVINNWDDILTLDVEALYGRITAGSCTTGGDQVTQWSQWSGCSVACGTGSITRTRTCDGTCTGVSTSESLSCNLRGCLGQWSSFSTCPVTCGGGTITRSRSCTDGTCSENLVESSSCNTANCPDTSFTLGQWGAYSTCTASCDGGTQTRTRTCSGACTGQQTSQTIGCNTNACQAILGNWSGYSTCTVSCGGGTQTRTRTCSGPCTGVETSQTIGCNTASCNSNTIGLWGQWSSCSLACGGGSRSRSRSCTGNCAGVSLGDTESCNTHSCGVVADFTQWSSYTACSAVCDGGFSYRTRSCLTGTTQLVSDLYETIDCNVQPCSSGLGQWGEFGACLHDCRRGSVSPLQYRTRHCLNSGDCNQASLTSTQTCNANTCEGNNLLCSDAPIAFVIVMDSSASVSTGTPGTPNSDQWTQEKNFVKQFARTLGVGTNSNVRLGLVNYGQTADIVARCDDTRTSNLDQFDAMVDALERKQGGTAINDALLKTTELLNSNGCGNRAGEVKAVFFLTDGYENVEFDANVKAQTEAAIKAQATIYVGAITDQVVLSEVQRIASSNDLVQIVEDFSDLEALDPNEILPRLLSASGCIVNGVYGAWSNWAGCSLNCGGLGTRSRTRSCTNPTGFNAVAFCTMNENVEYESCQAADCQGTLTLWGSWGSCSSSCHPNDVSSKSPIRIRLRHCEGNTGNGDCNGAVLLETQACNTQVACPANWGQWGAYGQCSATCQFDINNAPQQTRSRTCQGGNWGATCVGDQFESISCNVGVSCPGFLTQWSAYGACSASCQLGLQSPRWSRTRECRDSTFNGNCNGENLVEESDCNTEVQCPGLLSQWQQWGACSENCQSNANVQPTRTRFRSCTDTSFGGNCFGQPLEEEGTCNVGVGCTGQWESWSAYGQCSEACQSNVNVPPFQTRTRSCLGGTFGVDCIGDASETRSCSVGVACQGFLTNWSAYGSCSATCQLGLASPRWSRTRECRDSTFDGNCEGAALIEESDCNTEVACPGLLSLWGNWGGCSESCQSDVNDAPTRSRSRTCTNFSFGGNCNGATLTEEGQCNVATPCPGFYEQWSSYGTCSEDCHSNVNSSPFQTRTRVCRGGTFGGGCDGDAVETRTCNFQVACQGFLTNWSAFGSCSATCQLGLQSPRWSRTRECRDSTFNGNCNGENLVEESDCNTEVACPGRLTLWSDWGNCPESCQNNENQPSILNRFRSCVDTSFGGACSSADLQESKTCSEGIPCQGSLLQWSAWTECSASCQLTLGVEPTRSRSRDCVGETLTGNCEGAALAETESCNVGLGCPGTLTQWGQWTDCSETCHSNPAMAPTRARQRFCIETSLNGDCFGAELEQKVPCNELVICPRLGSWEAWGEWADCSQTCDPGFQSRNRTCSMGFPATAGDDCQDGDGYQTKVCNLGDCPVACPIKKRCNCSLAQQFNSPPDLNFFGITDDQIDAVVSLMNYWSEDIQKQLCDACSIPRLTISLNTVNDHLVQVGDMRARLESIKTQLRDIINCNNNVYIGEDLWKIYDHLWARCTMLGGVNTELMACQMRFQAAVSSCEKYGWFHQFMKQVYRKW